MSSGDGVTLVKLGGSLITDKAKPLTPRTETLSRLAEEIHDAGLSGRLVVGHGSGSFGHVTAARHEIHRGVRDPEQVEGVSATQIHAHRLHRLVAEALWKAGNLPFSLAPSAAMMAAEGEPGALDPGPLVAALDLGLLPVVFGDVLMDRAWGASICSTEQAFEAVVDGLVDAGRPVERVLWMGITDGVYDRSGKPIGEIRAASCSRLAAELEGAAGEDVTGGMRLRLETAGRLAERGIPSWILDGLEPEVLADALGGRPRGGTKVVP